MGNVDEGMIYKMNRRAFLFAVPFSLAAVAMAYGETDVLAEAFNRLPRSGRLSVQEKLAEGGFYNGGLDGAFGPGTRSAILNAAVFVKDNSYGKVVYDISSSDGPERFLAALMAGDLDKWLWGEGDEAEGG